MIIKNFFLIILSANLFQNSICTDKNPEFINVEKFISGFNNNLTNVDSFEFELTNIPYLDLKYYNYFDSLSNNNRHLTRYLHFDPAYYLKKDTLPSVNLLNSFQNIREVVCKPDRNLKKIIKETFGIEYEKEIFKKVLIYKNKAFVLFTYDIGQTALILDLKNSHSLGLTLVYSIIE